MFSLLEWHASYIKVYGKRIIQMRLSKSLNTRGVTLLEVMIAMIILSMSLLVLLNMAMVALDGNDWSNKTTVSTQLLQQKLEELRASGSLVSGTDVVNGVTRSWTVTNAGTHLRNVSVAITWQDVRNRTHLDSISALIRTDSV